MRDVVRAALVSIAARFSDDAPSVDERILSRRYGVLDAWPADSELGLFVLAWVLGSGFSLPRFREAVSSVVPNFEGAALTIGVGSNPTLVTLGGVARCGFRNGGMVIRCNLDPDVLYWPYELSRCLGATHT